MSALVPEKAGSERSDCSLFAALRQMPVLIFPLPMTENSAAPKVFLLDVDGVLTTGHFFYTADGKAMKAFGPDDNDGLSLLKPHLDIQFMTGDRKGFNISKKRIVDDMGFPLHLVSTVARLEWIRERWQPAEVIYMGDGIFDHYVMREVGYAIAPQNAHPNAKMSAHFVTQMSGGNRAVAEACLHVLEKFYSAYTLDRLPKGLNLSGEWTA